MWYLGTSTHFQVLQKLYKSAIIMLGRLILLVYIVQVQSTVLSQLFSSFSLTGGYTSNANGLNNDGHDGTGVGFSNNSMVDVMVVGSGLSGSTAAFYINARGLDVAVSEAKAEVGGNLISRNEDGFLWEEGANSFQPSSTILRFTKDLGLLDELVLADGKQPRWVVWNDKLHKLPSGMKEFITTPLLSWRGKLRVGFGLLGFVGRRPAKEESIKEFFIRHIGKEAFERLIDPFVSGVYAGDPSTLSMTAAFSKISRLEDLGFGRGLISGGMARARQLAKENKAAAAQNADIPKIPKGSLGSFQRGLQSIPLKVKESLGERVLLCHQLMRVEKTLSEGGKPVWVSTFQTPTGVKVVRSKVLLLTTPSHVTGQLLGGGGDENLPVPQQPQQDASAEGSATTNTRSAETGLLPEAQALCGIRCPPVASVTLAYPDSAFQVPLRGFGHLIPRLAKIRTLGSIWASSLFPGRAPAGYTMLTNFIGGSQDPEITTLTPEQTVAQVHADLQRLLLRPDAPAPRLLSYQLWARAIPQYEIGHANILKRLEEGLQGQAGLYLGGNYRTGVAIGDCIQYGVDVAAQVEEYLSNY